MKTLIRKFRREDSGAVAVYVGLGMVVLLGFAALALDIARMVSVKRELAKAAEAGALSGARNLWPLDFTAAVGRLPNCANAETWARTTTLKNQAAGANLTSGEVTVEVGRWNYTTKTFTPGYAVNANGVRVTTVKNNLPLLFAPVFGVNTTNLSGAAIAVMDFTKQVGKGCLPIAVNQDYSNVPGTIVYIGFNPDPEDNGGWFATPEDGVNASTLKDYIDGGECPPLKVGDTIDLQNGVVDAALKELDEKLAEHPDGWVTFLPVVDTPKFNHQDQIDAFVPFLITEVKKSGNPKYVKGTVLTLRQAESALPGGGSQGALAPPKLVN